MTDAFAHCAALVRAGDKDRFLSALFAPAEQRGALYALYAFNIELSRIPELVREPLAGEVRLQWWREAVAGERLGEARAHPVASALLDVISRYQLPIERIDEIIDARQLELGGELIGSLDQLELYARHTSSNVIALAARILGSEVAAAFVNPAGISMAIAGLLRRFAADAGRGELFLPADLLVRHAVLPQDIFAGQSSDGLMAALAELRTSAATLYEEARALMAAPAPSLITAWLPVALVPLYLRALQRSAHQPFRAIEVPQGRRQWALWRAARAGRLPTL
jgi:phytoene synthase